MKNKVNIILAAVTVAAILFAIFGLSKPGSYGISYEEHERNMEILGDTIRALKENLSRYEKEIDRISEERRKIREELNRILSDGDSVGRELSSGDWDDNIRFLTEFLSEDGDDRE